jgi:hypothetical protein
MLVSAVDRAVETVPFVVGIGLHPLKETMPLTRLGPSVKSIEHRLPRPKLFGQIAPRNTRSPPPQDCLNELAIILRWPPSSTLRLPYRSDLRPRPFVQLASNHPGRAIEHNRHTMETFLASISGTGTGTGTRTAKNMRTRRSVPSL